MKNKLSEIIDILIIIALIFSIIFICCKIVQEKELHDSHVIRIVDYERINK